MNNLNNNQLVLLAILVSFVTSIATGIFTVALIDQAPPSVTNTINRVVERTVETVVPSVKETIVKERVVVDKGGDLIVSAVQKTSPALVEIQSVLEVRDGKKVFQKAGVGFFVEGDGSLLSYLDPTSKELYLLSSKGEEFNIKASSFDPKLNLASFTIPEGAVGSTSPKTLWPALSLSGSDAQVGQTAIVLNSGTVAVSFISGLLKDKDNAAYYRLYLDESTDLVGAPVINVEEKVIGILRTGGELITAETISAFLKKAKEAESISADGSSKVDS